MSEVDSPEAPKQKPRRGRPPKVRRHDPVNAPVDGDPGVDIILNREPGYRYYLASDEDIPKLLYRGAERCERDKETAKPVFDVRAGAGDAHIEVKGLTMMKITEELATRAERPGLEQHGRRMKQLHKAATAPLGDGTHAFIRQHQEA